MRTESTGRNSRFGISSRLFSSFSARKFIGLMAAMYFLGLMVPSALAIYLLGGVNSFLEAFLWSAGGWGGWLLFCAIAAVIRHLKREEEI